MSRIYLDNNATTQVHPNIIKQLSKNFLTYGNPSSLHQDGQIARETIEKARESIADYINCRTDQLIFTSSGTESNNHVLYHYFKKFIKTKEPLHIITSSIEHHCVLETVKMMSEFGVSVSFINPNKEGFIEVEAIEKEIRPETQLISIMAVNNEIGSIQPFKEIANLAKKHTIHFHTDAVQALGKITLDINEFQPDYLTLSGHKINALKGIGVLYIKNPLLFTPFHIGGPQEQGLRAGTENTLGIYSLGTVIDIYKKQDKFYQDYVLCFKNKIIDYIENNIPNSYINSPKNNCITNTINVSFVGISSESLIMALDMKGVSISAGSACSTGSTENSHVLHSLGLNSERIESGVRISLSHLNTSDEINIFLEILTGEIKRLRK